MLQGRQLVVAKLEAGDCCSQSAVVLLLAVGANFRTPSLYTEARQQSELLGVVKCS